MGYRFLDDIAISDAAFEAWGTTQEELFAAAADALLAVQVDGVETVEKTAEQTITLNSDTLEALLFDFLQELIYLKDVDELLVRPERVAITGGKGGFSLMAVMYGERINRNRHPLRVDAKAVTLHRFRVAHENGLWKATVVIDI